MRRRSFNLGALAASLLAGLGWRSAAQVPRTAEDFARAAEDYRKKALANFPYPLIETTGEAALAKWQELKAAGRGTPVILGGGDDSFNALLTPFEPDGPPIALTSVESILKAADAIRFPGDLIAKRRKDDADSRAWLEETIAKDPDAPLPTIIVTDADGHRRTLSREEARAQMLAARQEPEVGDWPTTPQDSLGLSVATDILTGKALPKVYIALLPTADATEVPAYLRWGGWNACPEPAYHVAALRAWRERYGAELVGMAFDTLNLRVARKPKTRDEALALAREHYVYCSDIVEQGTQTFSVLASALMNDDWWYFWWD